MLMKVTDQRINRDVRIIVPFAKFLITISYYVRQKHIVSPIQIFKTAEFIIPSPIDACCDGGKTFVAARECPMGKAG